MMENDPPRPVGTRSANRTSLMQPLPHSKSSPAKRDLARILTPQYNHSTPPSGDVFNTGLLTPQASQNAVVLDAAKSLISPPPEDTTRAGTSRPSPLWTRSGSEPLSESGQTLNNASSSKRKRSIFPSRSLHDHDGPNQSQQMAVPSPNPKPRKLACRAHFESDAEDGTGSTGHTPSKVSPRKQRQSHAPPPESVRPDRVHRSPSLPVSPTKPRRSPTLLRSPHADKDKADYIPPVPSHTRQHLSAPARSCTPHPPYEPPTERFTPPREVVRSSPRVSKSSKRKNALKVTIKKEPPEIDLSRLPPPSPTDDPLLLHGRVRSPRRPIPTHARETPLLESTPPGPSKTISPFKYSALDFPLPGIPSDVDDNDDADLPEQPVFNFAGAGEDSWSSSAGGSSEQEGEYTGKFRVMHIPTKADPPTSTTRERIERWGRPTSPFPRKGSPIPEKDIDIELDETSDSSDLGLPSEQPQFHTKLPGDPHVPEVLEDAQGQESEIEAHQEEPKDTIISETVEIGSANNFAYDNHVVAATATEAIHLDQESRDEDHESFQGPPTYPQEDLPARLGSGDESAGLEGNTPVKERNESPQESHIFTQISDVHGDSTQDELVGEGQTDEVRALSEEPPPSPQLKSSRQPTPDLLSFEEYVEVDEPMPEAVDAEPEGDSSDDSDDLSVVKIVSDDPWAAARAAAILKQHDWDLVMQAARKPRPSRTVESLIRKARRADLASAGISKSPSPARSARSSFGVVVDGRVVMVDSPSMTLPELLHEAESELDSPNFPPKRGAQHDFRTPSPAPVSFRRPEAPLIIDTDGPREWSRSDWKLLDACFTDARLEVGARWGSEGTLGDVDAVELEDVVRRFTDIFGGEEVVDGLGPAFERKDLLKRARALRRKQRLGEGAPPTPSLRVSSVASSTPTVPDFTPVHPARLQWVNSMQPKLPAPAFLQVTPRIPASLMAPRYSHLLEEAKSMSQQDGSRPSPTSSDEPPGYPAPITDDRLLDNSSAAHAEPDQSLQGVPPTPSVGKRMKGFLFSYLPTLKKKTPIAHKLREPARQGLPLPPPELLEKPRGPVITPLPKPLPRVTHPKELVHLQHAPLPSRISTLPQAPKRMVELRPVSPNSPPSAASGAIMIPEGRRNSGGSVKDLVHSFEEMERSREIEERALQLRRQKSAGRLAASATNTTTTNTKASTMKDKPRWR